MNRLKSFPSFVKELAMNEGPQDTSWTNLEGETITLEEFLDLTNDIKVQDIELEKLKGFVLDWNESPEEFERIEQSDLQYPILILMNDNGTIYYILDGHHRIRKCIKYGIPTVRAKLIKFSQLPERVRNILGKKEQETITKVIKVWFDIDWNKEIGKVEDEFTLAFSRDSLGIYSLGEDIEKFIGLSQQEVERDIKLGKETPDSAIIYGMSNTMNGGRDIYLWTNGTRLSGASKRVGIWPAIIEQISHESTHLTRQILTRAISKNRGARIERGEWLTFDWGSGKKFWPSVGESGDKNNPIVLIDEEAFATSLGIITQTITPHFLEMASLYIPELSLYSIQK